MQDTGNGYVLVEHDRLLSLGLSLLQYILDAVSGVSLVCCVHERKQSIEPTWKDAEPQLGQRHLLQLMVIMRRLSELEEC